MEQGFTLIELLAVIVILAIIALIATPIVLNIINDAKESTVLRSADFYLDGVETAIATSTLKNMRVEDGTYSIMSNGYICMGTYDLPNDKCTVEPLKVEMDGEKPTGGTITIVKGQISDISLNLNDRVIVKNEKGELVLGESLQPEETSICKLIDDADNDKTVSPGDKYQCKVKDNMEQGFEDGYYFYVLSQELDGTTNLIMDRNINSDGTPVIKKILESNKNSNGGIYNLVAWINQDDYESNGGQNFGLGEDESDFGPVTAMNYLYKATKDWSNVPNIEINYTDEGTSYGYGNIKITGDLTQITKTDGTVVTVLENQNGYLNLKARMPYNSEVNDVGCLYSEAFSCPVWMVDYLYDAGPDYGITYQENPIDGISGYWTFSSSLPDGAVDISYEGSWREDSFVIEDNKNGVRPVINVKL